MDRENLQQTTPVLKKRKGYSLKFKQKELVELANNNRNFQNTSQRLDIPRQYLMRWFKQKDQIEESRNKIARQRLTNGTSRAFYPEMEQSLEQWIREERAKGVCISGFMIKVKAVEILRKQISGSTSPFKASDGWLANFLKRKNLTLRRITTTGRDLPEDSVAVIQKFIDNCTNKFTNFNRAQIINMDEIAVFLDHPSNYSYDYKGKLSLKLN